jgi:hypothetical protein
MGKAVKSKQKPLAAANEMKPKGTSKQSLKRMSKKTAAKQSTKTSKQTLSPSLCSLNAESSAAESSVKTVRFHSVQIKLYPRTLGDFDETLNKPMDYALSLDWPTKGDDDNTIPIITQEVDAFEKSKIPRYKSLVEYSDLGRLSAAQRCALLLHGMDVSDLAQQVGQRHGKTTRRGLEQVEHELQAFVKSISVSPESVTATLPPFVKQQL